jgi:lipoate-protein ligase A
VTNPAIEKDKIRPRGDGTRAYPAAGALFRQLEVIDDPQPHPAAFNMALDEALLDHADAAVVLRIYRWLQPAVSFGYFLRYDALRPDGTRELVRRWTGGGSVEHGADFTYSLIIPGAELATLGSGRGSYASIHHALGQALEHAGVAPSQAAAASPARTAPAPAAECFANPVAYDLLSEGRKIAGAAQRRTRRGLLHQGSVQGIVPIADWRERLARTLPRALCVSPAFRRFRPTEERRANWLAETKYGTSAWLQRF